LAQFDNAMSLLNNSGADTSATGRPPIHEQMSWAKLDLPQLTHFVAEEGRNW